MKDKTKKETLHFIDFISEDEYAKLSEEEKYNCRCCCMCNEAYEIYKSCKLCFYSDNWGNFYFSGLTSEIIKCGTYLDVENMLLSLRARNVIQRCLQ